MSWKDGNGPGKDDSRRASQVPDDRVEHNWNKSFGKLCKPGCVFCQMDADQIELEVHEAERNDA
jgi:hypothetical protein